MYTESKEEGRNFEYLQEVRYLKDIHEEHTPKENKIKIEHNSGEKAITIYFRNYDVDEQDFKSAIANFNDDECENDLKNAYSTFKTYVKEKHINYLDLYPIPIARARSRTLSLWNRKYYETYKF